MDLGEEGDVMPRLTRRHRSKEEQGIKHKHQDGKLDQQNRANRIDIQIFSAWVWPLKDSVSVIPPAVRSPRVNRPP